MPVAPTAPPTYDASSVNPRRMREHPELSKRQVRTAKVRHPTLQTGLEALLAPAAAWLSAAN